MSGVRAGVIGVGRLGAAHARILAELADAELVGVHDLDRERGERVARAVATTHFRRPDRLLESCEAVVVAVPTAAHRRVAGRALDAGCKVLVEKPLAATLREADELLSLAGNDEPRLFVGHVERFNPAIRACRAHLAEPRYLESLRLAAFQPRGTDVNVVLDLMIHDIDLVLGLVDSPVAELGAVGVSVLTPSFDIANARLGFENGAVANITASRVSEESKRELRLFQPSGYMSMDLAEGQGEFLRLCAPAGSAVSLADAVERIPLTAESAEPLGLELEAFLGAVRGEETASVSAKQGREALEVALRITKRIEEFAHVTVEDS